MNSVKKKKGKKALRHIKIINVNILKPSKNLTRDKTFTL